VEDDLEMLEDDLAMMKDNLEMHDLEVSYHFRKDSVFLMIEYISSVTSMAESVMEIKIFSTIHNF
jgi:hypothetical protein